MIFMDMICFKEVKFEYRGGFANNFGRMKIKSVITDPTDWATVTPKKRRKINYRVNLSFIDEIE